MLVTAHVTAPFSLSQRLGFSVIFLALTMGLLSNLKLKSASVTDKTQIFLNSGGSTSSTARDEQGGSRDGSEWTSVDPRDQFVRVHKGQLVLAGHPFRFAGLNAPELLDGNVNGPFEIEHTFRTLSMRGSFARAVTRTYTLQINSKNIGRGHIKSWHREWKDWEWDEGRLKEIDRVLAEARKYGVKLIIPIINQDTGEDSNWVGSYADLIRMRKGLSTYEESTKVNWWTDHEMIESQLIIDKLLNRVNHINGIRIGDDATILAFETGNEMNCNGMRPAPASWTLRIAKHLKSRAPQILVMDGSFARTESITGSYPIEVLQSKSVLSRYYTYDSEGAIRLTRPRCRFRHSDVDILSYHYYGSGDSYRVKKDCEYVFGKHGKAFVAGEMGFFAEPSMYDSFLKDLHKYGGSGALVWSLRPASAGGGYKTHGEGNGNFAMHIPGWATCSHPEFDPRERQIISILRHHSYKMNHQKTPTQHPVPPAPSKVWLDPSSLDQTHLLWTSAPWAHSYELILRDLSTGHEYGRRQVWDCTKEGESRLELSRELGAAPRTRLGVCLRGISLDGTPGPESEMLSLDSSISNDLAIQ
ncbi:BQ5605_C022g09479 [Microbotryum silenes-dioicae]|uniref:BQ5605_C022g09479 protein n=1 Tax=Microbotryum silenes-dioicae TaxID=796604 RepID=A0A2X0MPI2_9BASI|nr:BQ5605_C022g09479 [Microbotryum silenes-dioicae]